MKLYLGTEPPSSDYVHYPIIRIEPRPLPESARELFPKYTHIIFTSKNAVRIFLSHFPNLSGKTLIAVGKATASLLPHSLVASNECQEGVVELLQTLDLERANVLLPRSSQARHLLDDFLLHQKIAHMIWDLYDPIPQIPFPLPSLDQVEEIYFTSPSTVRAFFQFFGKPPSHIKIRSQGKITEEAFS
ncbi:MAG: uroporphyrinogen-III synthase [Verrucomicrobia bacterium]|nr:uroporphyrinogen-III synthase [Verrucomicrobiota bacterium]